MNSESIHRRKQSAIVRLAFARAWLPVGCEYFVYAEIKVCRDDDGLSAAFAAGCGFDARHGNN